MHKTTVKRLLEDLLDMVGDDQFITAVFIGGDSVGSIEILETNMNSTHLRIKTTLESY